ncbi:membrane-spanning 4-domains subfamily A member 4A-like [Scyliorhinus canicula]|uniref:membrane-spanning 4-domains subfamily A member 4A-like n=1 Tax=Scyliorhinus canicula TaxID=7830 RepID=UPI0018F30A2B|nr:membrane-spanning 4-domains subfamily A member 4A-like [Scyliorhinus canicula]
MPDFLDKVLNAQAQNKFPAERPLPNTPQVNNVLNQAMAATLAQNNAVGQNMLRGNLKALGITEIVTAIIILLIGIVKIGVNSNQHVPNKFSLIIGAPFWTAALFIIAGSLAVAVEREPTVPLIRGCLSMNIISAISCLPAIIIYFTTLLSPRLCYYSPECNNTGSIAYVAILIVLTLLDAAISITVSSFNCQAMNCCCASPVPVIVMYSNASEQLIPSQQFQVNPAR